MRRREFIQTGSGLFSALAFGSVGAIAESFGEVVSHATGRRAVWIGGNGDWHDKRNWSIGRVPDKNTDVELRGHRGCKSPVITMNKEAEVRDVLAGPTVALAQGPKGWLTVFGDWNNPNLVDLT